MCHSTVTSIGLRMAAPSETMIVVRPFLRPVSFITPPRSSIFTRSGTETVYPRTLVAVKWLLRSMLTVSPTPTRCAGMPSILAMFRSSL